MLTELLVSMTALSVLASSAFSVLTDASQKEDSQKTEKSDRLTDAKAVQERFLGGYPAAAKRLAAAANGVEASGHLEYQTAYVADFVYRVQNEHVQQVLNYDPVKRLKEYPNIHVRTFTPDYAFWLGGKSLDRMTVSTVHPAATPRHGVEKVYRVQQWVEAAFRIYNRRLIDVISDESFAIQQAKLTSVDGLDGLTIRFTLNEWARYPTSRGEVTVYCDEGEFTVLPSHDWALARFRVVVSDAPNKLGKPVEQTGEVTTDFWGPDRKVLPRSLVTWQKAMGEDAAQFMRSQFTSFEFGKIEDRQFLPSAFGLPDSILGRPVNRSRHGLWLLVASSVCLIVGAVIWRRSRLAVG